MQPERNATMSGSQLLVGMSVALIESAASLAAARSRGTWGDPLVHLYQAADQAWGPPDRGRQSWRTDPTGYGADFRLAVLLAEAAAGRALSDGGYLSGRQLAADLRRGAGWLAAGVPFTAAPPDR